MPNRIDRVTDHTFKAPDGCWLWLGGVNDSSGSHGGPYGRLTGRRGGRGVYAHVLAYEQEVGPVPEGRELDHLCRQPTCVRPSHLEPVTHRENMRRGDWLTRKAAV